MDVSSIFINHNGDYRNTWGIRVVIIVGAMNRTNLLLQRLQAWGWRPQPQQFSTTESGLLCGKLLVNCCQIPKC
jgi:hypothetical protein